jgi:SulP family sulfate permease
MKTTFLPKTFIVLRGYTRRQFVADLQAGLVVGVVAIPLALAFASRPGSRRKEGSSRPWSAGS